MKRLLLILILTFSFQLLTKADDIRDFQIEGISIGDSLLDYMSREEILEELKVNSWMYKNAIPINKFGEVYLFKKLDLYNSISFFVKKDDPNYRIYMIRGMIEYIESLNKCFEKKSEIVKDIEKTFNNFNKTENSWKKDYDPSGKSYTYQTKFNFENGSSVNIQCENWEESLRIEKNWTEGINVAIQTKEFFEWIVTNGK